MAALKISPVEIWGSPKAAEALAAMVPLPAPGAPKNTNFMVYDLLYSKDRILEATARLAARASLTGNRDVARTPGLVKIIAEQHLYVPYDGIGGEHDRERAVIPEVRARGRAYRLVVHENGQA
jgi:hypothetical protein